MFRLQSCSGRWHCQAMRLAGLKSFGPWRAWVSVSRERIQSLVLRVRFGDLLLLIMILSLDDTLSGLASQHPTSRPGGKASAPAVQRNG